MPEIFHDLVINATSSEVFAGITTSKGLDAWWTKCANAQPLPGGEYALGFGPGYDWKAVVTAFVPDKHFELEMTGSNESWQGTRISFVLTPRDQKTVLSFSHTGWRDINDEFRFSSYCWAMYLRLLRRYLELGEEVLYGKRLSV